MPQDTDTRARILIVEDELIIAQNLKFRLEKLGYGVTDITIDAEEARASLKKEVPDLVLMDIALYGGNDGVILAKWIDKNYRIPVIYVTSHTDNSTFERASKSMPYGYLIKPFNPKELYNTIELALQRHQLLQQLSSSSHLLGSVLQSIGDAIVVADKHHNILYMNDSANRLLETRYDDTSKLSIGELLPFRNIDDENPPPEWHLGTVRDFEEIEFECRLKISQRANFLHVRLSKLDTHLQRDVPEGYLVIMRDITRRKKSESSILNIAESVSGEIGDAYFSRLTEQLTKTLDVDCCVIGEIDENNPDRCIIAATYTRDSGYPEFKAFQLDGTPAGEAVSRNESLVCVDNVTQKYPEDKNLAEFQAQGFAATPLTTADDQTVGIIMVLTHKELEESEVQKPILQIFANRAAAEIERRRYEQRIIAERNRANEMNALKDSFLSNLSHEVRTPLNSIIGFASLLGEELKNPEQQNFISFIQESGQRLLQTINDLLDLSILESEPGKMHLGEIDLEAEIREAVGMMQNEARDKNLLMDFVIKASQIKAYGDHHMTSQVMRKLLDNAIKFTKEGSVMVELDKSTKEDKEYAVIRVIDTGIGIKKSFLPHVFDEFKQESWGLARKYEGVGLGLTIAKKMTHLMHGEVEVESEKDKGSVFTVYLPLAN